MLRQLLGSKLTISLAAPLFLVAAVSTVSADQLTLAYVDVNAQAQTLTIDCNSSTENLAKAARLLHEIGVGVKNDPAAGCSTLAELAAALASAAPAFAADIAQALAALSPQDQQAIVSAINAVAGVNTTAVLAAVHFGTPERIMEPATEEAGLPEVEQIPSDN